MLSALDDIAPGELESSTVCWDGLAETSLALSLSPPVSDCVERDLLDSHRRRIRPRAACRHLGLVVTARSAYQCPIARAFVDAISERIRLSDDVHERAHTALQEAVLNAVLHGNLGLDSDARDDLAGLERTHAQIEQLLLLPQIALSAIRIDAIWNSAVLVIMVRDSGAGFDRAQVPSPDEWMAAGHIGSGRGFQILEAFCDRLALLRGGTLIKLGFKL
uniref:Putative anti-sigma regulatory factor, serine/threonine protein kinase n=1 Tax=Rhodopseudomonas palustris (strain BisA53) TaxID=316055 RepID=Q07SD1_RHOP5